MSDKMYLKSGNNLNIIIIILYYYYNYCYKMRISSFVDF